MFVSVRKKQQSNTLNYSHLLFPYLFHSFGCDAILCFWKIFKFITIWKYISHSYQRNPLDIRGLDIIRISNDFKAWIKLGWNNIPVPSDLFNNKTEIQDAWLVMSMCLENAQTATPVECCLLSNCTSIWVCRKKIKILFRG